MAHLHTVATNNIQQWYMGPLVLSPAWRAMKGISYIGYINPYPLSGRTTWGMQQHMDNGSWLRPHSCRCNYGMWVSTFIHGNWQKKQIREMVLSIWSFPNSWIVNIHVPMMVHLSDLCSWVSQGPATLGFEAQATPQRFSGVQKLHFKFKYRCCRCI